MKQQKTSTTVQAQPGTYLIQIVDCDLPEVYKTPVVAWVIESYSNKDDNLFVTAFPVAAGYGNIEADYQPISVLFPDGSVQDIGENDQWDSVDAWIPFAVKQRKRIDDFIASQKS